MAELEDLVLDLPTLPGVYIWKNENGEILYIGKAKELRKRVRSYLRIRGQDRRTWELMQRAKDIETIITNTELEALLVEATLIKKHQPKYNLALKDDRKHAWIRVDLDAEIPTFEVTRDIEQDGAKYYGPYGSTKRLERFLDAARRYIPIAMCRDPKDVKRECMDFHIDRCVAPCTERVPIEEYRAHVEEMCYYLEGREQDLTKLMEKRMEDASANLEFEKAAELRDRLLDIEIIMRRQRVVGTNGIDRDVLGISRTEQAAMVQMLIVRGGRLIGYDQFYFEIDLDTSDSVILKTFLEQFYFTLPRLPEEILLPSTVPSLKQLGIWLRETSGTSVKILVPKDHERLELIDMANKNAYRALRKVLILGESEEEIIDEGVKELKEALGLGKAPTGSCVVFRNGVPDNKSYRMFKIRVKQTPDDYAMMNEVVRRRYHGVLERGESLPDLIIIDGGKGQLNVTLSALRELGLDYLAVAAVAKREERLYTRSNMDGILLPLESDGLHLIQRVRDEAHRFAQRYHHKLREKRFSGSILEEAPGIGPKRRTALLQALGSYDGVKAASIEEIAQVDGMTQKAAENLRKWLDSEEAR
jgi:excinuclease ABC subunit C